MDLPEDLGQIIARLRKDAGMSQRELADASGFSADAIASWEAGRRRPRGTATIDALATGLGCGDANRALLHERSGTALPARGLARSLERRQLPLRDMAWWIARYPWPCLIQNDRHELLAWNAAANRVAETDLATMLPTPEQRNLLWMAILPHFRDVRLTNWNTIIGRLMSFYKLGGLTLSGDGPPWLTSLIEAVLHDHPDVLGRLLELWQTSPPWVDGERNVHRVEWRVQGQIDLAFDFVSRIWSAHDGIFVMDWHPANAATWEWLEGQPPALPEATAFVEQVRPLHDELLQRRRALGISRKGLAASTGVSASSVAAYEHGYRRPRRPSLMKLARGLSLSAEVTNAMLREIGEPTVASDYASWLAGRGRDEPMTTPIDQLPPRGVTHSAFSKDLAGLPFPVLAANESCEIIDGNAAAKRIIDWERWPARDDRPGPHILDVILSDAFRDECLNWDDLVRGIVPVELEPLVLGRTGVDHKTHLSEIVRAMSPETRAALREAFAATNRDDAPRVGTLLELRGPRGRLLRFHCMVDPWNSFDPIWAIDLHPADSATWRWLGR